MIRSVQPYLYVIYSLILGLFIVNTFVGNDVVEYIVGLLAIPMLGLSFYGASRLFRILGSIFIVVGLSMFMLAGLPWTQIPYHMTSTLNLLAFLTVLPWINSVVRAGLYDRRINDLMKGNVDHLGQLYMRSSLTTYILCTFLNLSAISLSQGVLLENLKNMKKRVRDSFISRTTLRAFTLALIWSPMEIMVALTVDITGVSYLVYLPWLLLTSFIVLVIDWLWGRKTFSNVEYEGNSVMSTESIELRKVATPIIQLSIALMTFLSVVVTFGNTFDLDFILAVTLVILPFSFAWALMMRRVRRFVQIGWKTWKLRTNGMQNFVVLFVSLAFFSNSLNETSFLGVIQEPFLYVSDTPLLILILIQLTYLLMSMIGMHPVATIAILGEIIQPLLEIVNPLSIGIVLITGALATASVGTYGVTVTMTSMNTEENPYRITLRNMPFSLMFGAVGVLVAFLLL
ncbi:hypothetical protein [Texcoconibacillus texcoconensis]|uniref:Citrate transporter-like domain-containing protein n=1 Tax=Texcoconibacillus texcoconensis TaxID=1095777 RepID=A0A840QME2_9BACI|nr:hypothetical protein [Texcoconibacillus texcoconensis]